jgi:flagellar hook-basal body complex protein FliE
MTLPIGAVSATAVSPVAAGAAPAATASTATSGAGFAGELGRGLDWLQQTQSTADNLAVKAATGDLTDVHDYMIASAQASLATELTVAVRNKAVDAFNEIMRMQG